MLGSNPAKEKNRAEIGKTCINIYKKPNGINALLQKFYVGS